MISVQMAAEAIRKMRKRRLKGYDPDPTRPVDLHDLQMSYWITGRQKPAEEVVCYSLQDCEED